MGYELNPFTKKLDKVGAGGGGGTTNITGVITVTPGGNTAGVTNAISSGSVMLAGGNNITLSQNGSTISFVGADAAGGIAASLSGNTAGVMAPISTGTMYLAGGNNVTLSQNANSVTISGPNTVAQTQFVLSNSNGISFGTNGSTVTATVRTDYQSAGAYLTTAMQSNNPIVQSINGSSGTFSLMTASSLSSSRNGNSISFGLASNITTALQSAGPYLTTAQPVGAYLTTARASNDAIGLNTALTGNGVAMTANSSGLSLNIPAFLTTAAQSGHSHGNPTLALTNLSGTTASASNGLTLSLSAAAPGGGGGAALKGSGTYTQNTGTVEFANSNGITFGLSNNGTMTASHNGLTSQTVQTQNLMTVNGTQGNVSISGGNGVTVGNNASTITISVATNYQAPGAYLTTARASNDGVGLNTAITNGTWTVNSSGISLNLSNHLTTAMASNRGSDFVQATAAFAGTNASGTIASNGISVSVAAPGGGAAPTASASNGSFTFNTIGFSNANNVTFGTSAGSIITASVAAPGGGAQATATMWYPYNEAVNVLGVQGNATWQFAPVPTPLDRGVGVVSVDRAVFPMLISNATNITGSLTVSLSMGLYTLTQSSLSMAYSASGSFGLTYSGTVRNSVNSGIRLATIPFNTVIDADRYYVGIAYRSTTAGGNATVNQVLVSQLNSNFSGLMGEASNRSHQWPLGLGVRSASSSGFFSSIAFSQLDGTGSLAARPPSWHMRLGTV